MSVAAGGGGGTGDAGHGRKIRGAITTVHRYELPLPREAVWSLMSQVERYRSWWPWLRQFEGEGLSVGDEWRCMVQPPVPYLVRFRVVIDHVEAPGAGPGAGPGRRGGRRDVDARDVAERRPAAGRARTATAAAAGGSRVRGEPAELAGAGQHRAGGRVALRRADRPLRARLGPRLRRTAVHRQGGRARPRRPTLRRREVLLPADPGLRRGGGAGGADRIELRRQGHDHRRRHRLGRGHDRVRRYSQSIERGHEAVKQVVVRVPDGSTSHAAAPAGRNGHRRRGGGCVGVDATPRPTEVVGRGEGDQTTEMESVGASADETQRLEISAVADAPATERLEASAVPTPVPPGLAAAWRRREAPGFTWQAIAGTAAVVFVLALLFVTAVELIAGKPLASIFGSTDTGPTVRNLFNPSPATNSTTTTTSTTTPSSTTTSTTSSSTTTSSTNTTTTTTPSTTGLSGTTTTTNLGATTTTSGSATTTTTSKP